MVACDVHGKNHHREGTFGRHVLGLTVRVGDDRIVTRSQAENVDLFRATIGGMGLTGAILDVTVRLVRVPSCWLYEERQRVHHLDERVDVLKTSSAAWPMTVAWIDRLAHGRANGRGVIFRGRWAQSDRHPSCRFTDVATLGAFRHAGLCPHSTSGSIVQCAELLAAPMAEAARNRPCRPVLLSARRHRSLGATIWIPRVRALPLFLPESHGRDAVRRFMDLLSRRRGVSFLGVIKDCGAEGSGRLSFPKPGTSSRSISLCGVTRSRSSTP